MIIDTGSTTGQTGHSGLVFQDIERGVLPYTFFTCRTLFTQNASECLLDWFEHEVPWRLHEGSFYEQWECDLLRLDHPSSCAGVFSKESLEEIKRRVGLLLAANLGERMTVTAHKLVRSQEIGVHNDDPTDGNETHRLVVQLNRADKSFQGGELKIHNSRMREDIFRVVQPLHNSAFGFAMSSKSYHSVAQMGDWTRYSIIFSFWEVWRQSEQLAFNSFPRQRSASDIVASLPPPEIERLGQLTDFLQNIGANRTGHSDGTLIEHLVHTYLILRSWRCSVELSTAGLFHSVYGTAHFRNPLLGIEDRPALAQIIGVEAEEIAYLYGASARQSFFDSAVRGRPYHIVDHLKGKSINVDTSILRSLITLDLANSIEQLPRLKNQHCFVQEDRSLYNMVLDFLPSEATSAARQILGCNE